MNALLVVGLLVVVLVVLFLITDEGDPR